MAAKLLNIDSQISSRSQLPSDKFSSQDLWPQHVSGFEGVKRPRMLHTSPIVDVFLRKAAIMGLDLAYELEDKHERIASNVKRKWNVQPALTVE